MNKNQITAKINSRVLKLVRPFMGQEELGGIVLTTSVPLAMVLANTTLGPSYHNFFQQILGFLWGGGSYLNFTLHHWTNDGLVSVFFSLVGLELRHEFIAGELADLRNTVLPIGVTVGGMLIPAAAYLPPNVNTEEAMGWAIPVIIDIAFALGVVSLLGSRVPSPVKVFLTTLTVVGDLGAIIAIALLYTSETPVFNVLLGLDFLLLMFVGNKLEVKDLFSYALLGTVSVWVCFLLPGAHAITATVLAVMTIPADSEIDENALLHRVRKLTRRFDKAESNDMRTLEKEQVGILVRIQKDITTAIPPLQLIEHHLSPIVTFIMLLASVLTNAGVNLVGIGWSAVSTTNIAIGVALELLLGKPLGMVGISWLLNKFGFAKTPADMSNRRPTGLGFLASIGLTMLTFVSTLAFQMEMMPTRAKIGIFVVSILGGLTGYKLLKSSNNKN